MFRKVGPVVAALFLFVSFLVSASLAQTSRSEVSASLTGDFSKETDGQGIAQVPSQSVGFLASYRFSLSSRSAVELNYAYTKNDQNYDFGRLRWQQHPDECARSHGRIRFRAASIIPAQPLPAGWRRGADLQPRQQLQQFLFGRGNAEPRERSCTGREWTTSCSAESRYARSIVA